MDVTIVGGGICGLSAALALHKRGISCRIISESVGNKTCGGGLTEKEIERYQWIRKYGDEFASRSMTKAHMWFGAAHFEVDSYIHICDRKALDLFLAQQVRDRGIPIERARITSIDRQPSRLLLKTNKGMKGCQTLYDASGALGPLSDGQSKERWVAVQHIYPVGSSFIDRHIPDEFHIDFGFKQIKQYGYLWIFPDRDEIKVGLGFLHKYNLPQAVLHDEILHFIKRRFPQLQGKKYRTEGAFISAPAIRMPVEQSRYFVGGDAAGLVNVLGEGNYFALLSSELFAESVDAPPGSYTRALAPIQSSLERQYRIITTLLGNPTLGRALFRSVSLFKLNAMVRGVFRKNPIPPQDHSLIRDI